MSRRGTLPVNVCVEIRTALGVGLAPDDPTRLCGGTDSEHPALALCANPLATYGPGLTDCVKVSPDFAVTANPKYAAVDLAMHQLKPPVEPKLSDAGYSIAQGE